MATVKGKVISAREITTETGREMFFVKLEGSDTEYSGFGKNPYKEGEVAEFEYTTKKSGDRVYYNIRQKKESQEQKKDEDGDLKTLIKTLAMPKVSVSIEQTIQVNQYEPKKFSAFISVPITEGENAAERIKHLFDVIEAEISARINGNPKGGDTPTKTEKSPEGANLKPESKSGVKLENANTSEKGQKSLITNAMEKEGLS